MPDDFSINVKRQCGLGYLQHEPSKPGGIAATGLPFSACHPASLGTGPATSISGSRRVSSEFIDERLRNLRLL